MLVVLLPTHFELKLCKSYTAGITTTATASSRVFASTLKASCAYLVAKKLCCLRIVPVRTAALQIFHTQNASSRSWTKEASR
mmetsp:Transcript_1520/g.2762  ORF Transcript_1520/g.2762 Transcript_1520/m.2762 type:complete len:82 (-) Transcript_1520:113-358(-)